jgi:hypothetical protein
VNPVKLVPLLRQPIHIAADGNELTRIEVRVRGPLAGFPLQPEADPSEALWRKKHAGMMDFENSPNSR